MNRIVRGFLLGFGTLAVVVLIAWAAMRQGAKPGSAPQTPAPTQDSELKGVPRVSIADARERIDRGAVLVIDVRDADSYIASHIPGALQIPLARIEGEVNYLPRTKPILTYCT